MKLLAEPTLAHRIIVNPALRMRGGDSRHVIRELLTTVPVPGAMPTNGEERRASRQAVRT